MNTGRRIGGQAIGTAAVLMAVFAASWVTVVLTDAQYDDRNALLQLFWWLANTWLLPFIAIVVLCISAVKSWLASKR